MAAFDSEDKLVVTHIISGDIWAGAEAQAFQLISELQANGIVKPTVIVFNPGALFDKLKASGIDVALADETDLSPLGQIKTICRHLRHSGTDVLHTHGFKENVLGTSAKYLTGVKHSVLTVHGSPESLPTWSTPKQKLTQILDHSVTRLCHDAVIAVSQHLQTLLEPRYPRKTVVIRNFIDTDDIKITPPAKTDDIQEPARPFRAALVGRCVPVKRIDLFIDTIARLRTAHQLDVEGRVCGAGPLLEPMKQYAKDKGMDQFVRFQGFLQDMEPEWLAMDALIMPSDHEGLPMTLLEALAREVPVIAHNVGGIPEVLDQGNSGILVDNHNAKGYADKLAQVIAQPEMTRPLTINGLDHVRREFDKRENVKKYQALYQAIALRKPHPAQTI